MILSVVKTLVILYETGQLLARFVTMRGDLETILKFITWERKVKKAELAAIV